MGSLSELAYEYRNSGFQIYGLLGDVRSGDSAGAADAESLFKSAGGSFNNMVLTDSVINAMMDGVSAVPTTKFYDGEGRLLTTVRGANSKQEWINIIETVMYEKA